MQHHAMNGLRGHHSPSIRQPHLSNSSQLSCGGVGAGEISAVEALRQAAQSLKQLCGHMKASFEKERDGFVAADPAPMSQ